jgi:sporulation protein YtfJ
MEESKLNGVINTSLSSIKGLVDANTVVGQPFEAAGGTVIIPVSKMSVGYASGGVDFFGKNNSPVSKNANFGGGGGTGVTLTPVGFLVTKKDGSVQFLPVTAPDAANGGSSAPAPDKIDKLVDVVERSPEIVEKILSMLKKKKKKSGDEKADEDAAGDTATETADEEEKSAENSDGETDDAQ